MNATKYKIIGIALLAVDLLGAIAYQVFGTGLVSTSPSGQPHSGMTSQGFVLTMSGGRQVVIHLFNLLSLAGIALLAVIYLLRSRRHEPNA